MSKTKLPLFVLFFTMAGVGFAENPVRESEPAKETAESARIEESAPKSSLGEFTWLGKLVDQTCKEKHIDQTCPVSPATEKFGLVIDGGIIVPFDDAGNQKAKELVAKDGRKGNIEVSVEGGRQGGAFSVESIKTK